MNNRREFLMGIAAGAAVLGAETRLGFGEGAVSRASAPASAGKSRVVLATDPHLRVPGPEPNPQRIAAMLDHAMRTYAGTHDPVEPWKRLVRPGQVVGLKVNTIAGRGLSTHVSLVNAICERLQHAGIRPGNIIVWDRTSRELRAAGYTLNTDPSRVRCFGSDQAGYESAEVSHATSRTHLSKIMTQCDVVINVPILKNHRMSGVTMAMKNMYGVIDNPNQHHGDGSCNPYIADLNMIPEIRHKVKFVVGDVMTSIYNGGPGYRPEFTWNYDGLMVGEDRVAIDYVGWQIIAGKRAEMKMKTLEEAGMAPRYIATAADAAHRLGSDNPARIDVVRTSLA